MRHGPAGIWWPAAPRERWPTDPEQMVRIEAEFDGEYGDRRHEIVFMGQNLEPERTRDILDRSLLTEEEMAVGPTAWKALDDPFPRWFAEKNED